MLNKLLNPFGIKLIQSSPGFDNVGTLTLIVLHLAFYFTVFHFIHKFW